MSGGRSHLVAPLLGRPIRIDVAGSSYHTLVSGMVLTTLNGRDDIKILNLIPLCLGSLRLRLTVCALSAYRNLVASCDSLIGCRITTSGPVAILVRARFLRALHF